MKKVEVAKKNTLLIAIVALMVAVLILSIVLPLTLIDRQSVDGSLTPDTPSADGGVVDGLPVVPGDTSTGESTLKYAAGEKIFNDRVVDTGSVERDYTTDLSSPTEIATEEQFLDYIAATTERTGNYVLTSDITVTSGNIFTTSNLGSSAGFDGQGHTITFSGTFNQSTSCTVDSFKSSLGATGIFAKANHGVIKNVKLVFAEGTDVDITAAGTAAGTGAAVGIVAGWNAGTIRNVSVKIEDTASVVMNLSSADSALGGIVGAAASRSSSAATIDNAKVTVDGTLAMNVGTSAYHVGVGGIIGRLEDGTYTHLHIDGEGSIGTQGTNGAWKFVGGISGWDRATAGNGSPFPNAGSSTTVTFDVIISTFTGSFDMPAHTSSNTGESYVGHLFGYPNGRAFSYTLYSVHSSIASATGNITTGISSSNMSSVGYSGIALGSATRTHRYVNLTNSELGFVYSASTASVVTGDGWDGIAAVYSGDQSNISTSEISSATNATIDMTYGYVMLGSAGDNSFGWIQVRDSAVWPAGVQVGTVGDIPTGYVKDTVTATAITSTQDFITKITADNTGSYYLDADITAPSDFVNKSFSGYLDGNGHTITITGASWSADTNTQTEYNGSNTMRAVGGLFGVNSGVIRNLKVVYTGSASVSMGTNNIAVGLVVGGNSGTISNVSITMSSGSSITVAGGIAMFGGLVGSNKGVLLYTEAVLNGSINVTSGNGNYAGAAGLVGGMNGGSITLSSVKGTPSIPTSTSYFTGAVGYAWQNFSIPYFIYDIDTTNVLSASKAAIYNLGSPTITGSIYHTKDIVRYNGTNGMNTAQKVHLETNDSNLKLSFVFDNSTNFYGLITTYGGTSNVTAGNFSDNLADKYTYDPLTNKNKVIITANETGTYSFSWTTVFDDVALRELLASTEDFASSVKLTENITLTGTPTSPIVIKNHDLLTSALIDGDGYTITISGDVEVAADATGILASTNYGTIRNLKLVITTDININKGNTSFGLLVGTNDGSVIVGSTMPGQISNVEVSGNGSIVLTSEAETVIIGGIAANVTGDYANISNVTSTISIPNRLVATSTHATGTAIVGGIVGVLNGGLSKATVNLLSDGSIKADSSYKAIVGGAVGQLLISAYEVNVTDNANAGGGILATNIDNSVYVGGIVGTASAAGVLNFSKISGGGTIGSMSSPDAWDVKIGGLIGENISTNFSIVPSNVIDFKGNYVAETSTDAVSFIGKAFGSTSSSTSTASGTMNIFYAGDSNLTGLIGDSSASNITLIHHRVEVEGDIIIKGEVTSLPNGHILVNSVSPTMGIENASTGVSYNSITNSVILTPQSSNTVFTWDWVTDYGGISNYGETIVYGEDYTLVDTPIYTDGWATDYGRVIAGYGIPSTAVRIETSAKLLEWLSIVKKVVDGRVYYEGPTAEGTTQYSKAEYDYAYLSNDIEIPATGAVFFNAQGILDEGRTLDGCGYTITTRAESKWYSEEKETIPAEIYDPSNAEDSEIIAKAGLTGLGSGQKITVTSGLVAINHGTIKNVTYKVAADQRISDRAIYKGTHTGTDVGYNWVHGYIAGINTGVIENVHVKIDAAAQFHHDDNLSGFVYIIGGVTGYNYNGRVSYSGTTIASTGLFNSSSRQGALIFGGVVGLSNGGILDHLKLAGSGTMSITDLRKTNNSTIANNEAPYMFGGIIGAMENSKISANDTETGVNLSGSAGIYIKQTSFNYAYNGFTGTYATSKGSSVSASAYQYIYQGMIAGRVSNRITKDDNNPTIKGIIFIGKNNYDFVQSYTNPGSYNYTNTTGSTNSTLTPFGGLESQATALFSCNALYVGGLAYGTFNGYYDYWTRLDTSNNGFAVEFENVAYISTVVDAQIYFGSDSTSSLASGSFNDSSNISWNQNNTYRVYVNDTLLSGSFSSGSRNSWSIRLTVSQYTPIAESFAIGTLAKSSQRGLIDADSGIIKQGTPLTGTENFPLSGNGTYYLNKNITVSSSFPWHTSTEFGGTIYGNGYTITFTDNHSTTTYGDTSHTYNAYSQGVLTTRMNNAAGKIYDLNVVYDKNIAFAKASEGGDNVLKSVGVFTGSMQNSSAVIDNCTLTTTARSVLRGDQEKNWNDYSSNWWSKFGIATGGITGHISNGTISNVLIEHKGSLQAYGTVDGSTLTGNKPPDLAAGAVAGLTGGSAKIQNVILAGSGTIDCGTNYVNYNFSNAIVGCNMSGSVSIKNIALWGMNYTLTSSGGSSSNGHLVGTSSQTSVTASNIYSVNGTATLGSSATSVYYYDAVGTTLSAKAMASYNHTIRSLTLSTGSGGSSASNPNIYMDAAMYLTDSTSYVAIERYILRNSHRGNIIWSAEGLATYYADSSKNPAEAYWTRNSSATNHNAFAIGTRTKIMLVDGHGNIVSTADVVDERNYDGSSDVTAVFDTIEEVIAAGFLTAEEAGYMLPEEQEDFLKNKYQYSYQIYDITGTTPLYYTTWQDNTTYTKPLTTGSEFVGTYSISAPTQKTFNSVSYDYFNSTRYVLAAANSSGISSFNYKIKEAILIAEPAVSTKWASAASINYYIPRGEVEAITRLEFYDDPQGLTSSLMPYISEQGYSSATMSDKGGISNAILTEKDRGGTTYYVGAFKFNQVTSRYERVASNATIITMIDSAAPLLGIMRPAGLDTNITAQDVTYIDDDLDGLYDYGEIRIYAKDVSLKTSSYSLSSSPSAVRYSDKTIISVEEYSDGVIYTIRCYDSAIFTLTATDELKKTTTVKFTIDIESPQLVIQDQISTYQNASSPYDGVKFINNKEHRIYIASLTDNLAESTQNLIDRLNWRIVDSSDNNKVLLESTYGGQYYNAAGGYIVLPLSGTGNKGVLYESAVLSIWSEDDVGHRTTIVANNGNPIIIDTRDFIVRYGESLITEEGNPAAEPTLYVIDGATGAARTVNYNNTKSTTLKRFDSVSISNDNTRASGFTYIGFGVDVDYVSSGDRSFHYSQESLEIDVNRNHTVSLDCATYGASNTAMTTELKLVLFYTVALDITLNSIFGDDYIVDVQQGNLAGIALADIVDAISLTVDNSTYESNVVNSSTFKAYIDMVVTNDENVELTDNIPLNIEGIYSITFTVKADENYDKYYTMTSSLFSVSIVNPNNVKVNYTMDNNTISLTYNTPNVIYGGEWQKEIDEANPPVNYGWEITSLLQSAYQNGILTITTQPIMDSQQFIDQYEDRNGTSIFEDMRYTVIYNGSVYRDTYLYNAGTYNITAQIRANKGYTGTFSFVVNIAKASLTFRPFEQQTVYGYSIATDAYYVKWSEVSTRDKQSYIWQGLSYEPSLDDANLASVYYYAQANVKVIVGELNLTSNKVNIFGDEYDVVTRDDTAKTLSIDYLQLKLAVLSENARTSTVQRNVNTYTGASGIIMTGGSSNNYSLYYTGQYAPRLTITRRYLKVEIIGKTKYYNGDDPAEYTWQPTQGTFAYNDGNVDFETKIYREYPANGVDEVGKSYRLYGTVSNPNYNVEVVDGELTVEALHLNYYVTGVEDLIYAQDKDHLADGTLDVVVTNAKKNDNVTAEIYYLIGYSILGSSYPIYVNSRYEALEEEYNDYINVANRTFTGRLTDQDTEPIKDNNPIAWNKSGKYSYIIVASSDAVNFSTNYTNIETDPTEVYISGNILNVVVLDQIVKYGSNIYSTSVLDVTYKLEGIVEGDTVSLSSLTLSTLDNYTDYEVGKYVGVITADYASYTSAMGLEYTVNYVYGNLTVEQKDIMLDWSAISNTQIYTGADLAALFTSGVEADITSFNNKLSFSYYNAQGTAVATLVDAGGYIIKASLPAEDTNNYIINENSEYFAVNIDKAPITLKAFKNDFWNATDDLGSTVSEEYPKFTSSISLSTILSSTQLTLHNSSGGALPSSSQASRPADYSTWKFVVSNLVAANVTHTTYGGGNTALPTDAAASGTYEVIVIVPESRNYRGVTQRVIFVVDTDKANGGNVTYARQSTDHYTVSSETTRLTDLASKVGYVANTGTGSPSKLYLNQGTVGAHRQRQRICWMYYYFDFELSDEYFMLAQQGLLSISITGSIYSARWPGIVTDWGESDSTAVIVRGIPTADDNHYGTTALGEQNLDATLHPHNIYTSIFNMSNTYAGRNDFRNSPKVEYTTAISGIEFNGNHSSYRVYLLAWISDNEIKEHTYNQEQGSLHFEFSGLQINVKVASSTAANYTMETVDKSSDRESTETFFIPTSQNSLYNLNANPAWVKTGNTTYYFTRQSNGVESALYYDTAKSVPATGSTVTVSANYLTVKLRTIYNSNARAWRFTVGDTSTSTVGIDPQSFEIAVRDLRTNATEVWSVANGMIFLRNKPVVQETYEGSGVYETVYQDAISAHYNQIIFETKLLDDKKVSLESLTVYDYAGNVRTLKEISYLDNDKPTISDIKISSNQNATNYVQFSTDKWYNDAQYLEFTVSEQKNIGYTGINTGNVSVYYYDANGVRTVIPVQSKSAETEGSGDLVISAILRTTAALNTSNVYYISAKDRQGNETIYTLDFHFDDTDEDDIAVIEDENIVIDSWYDGDVTIRTEVTIDLEQNKAISLGKLQYLATTTDLSTDAGESYKTHNGWLSMTLQYDSDTGKYYSDLTVDKTQMMYYMFRFETGAGNYIYKNLGLVKIDKGTPTIDVTVFNTATDNLVLSGRWEKGSVTFFVTGTIGLSGGTLEYTSGGVNSSTWYQAIGGTQPAQFTITQLSDNLYTATIVVSGSSRVESKYAIRYTAGNGKQVVVVFGNGTTEFNLKIDNIAPVISTDVISWQSQAQDALINIVENESGVGNVVVEEKAKGSDQVIAFFTVDGAYIGAYADYVEGVTQKFIDTIYDIVRIDNVADFAYVENANYAGRVFKYTGDTNGRYTKDSYWRVSASNTLELIGDLPTASTSEAMAALLKEENVGNFYRFTGTSSTEFSNNSIYKVVEDGSSYRFKVAQEGLTRKISAQGGRYYFKFDDRDYTIRVYDEVGNEAQAGYTPQVDSYEPTINVVAIQYEDESSINFTYHIIDDPSEITFDSKINDMIKVYMHGDDSAAYHILLTQEGDAYFAYIYGVDGSNMVKAQLPTTQIAYRDSFSLSSATSSISQLGLEEIIFYPSDARLQVRAMDDTYGDGVAPEHIYDYDTFDNTQWTTNTVKFIVTRWTAGPSGGALYYSNGIVSSISQWQLLRNANSFGSSEGTYKDYSNQNISLIADADGAVNYTFFYRSTSNIMVYYNYVSHKSETKNSIAESEGKYAFMVKKDTTAPIIGKPEYLTKDGVYSETIANKQDWWTTGAMEFRFTVEDGGEQKVTKSGINTGSIKVVCDEIEIIPQFNSVDNYYHFSITKTGIYTIMVTDNVGNYAETVLTQAGGSAILVDTVAPDITVNATYDAGNTTSTGSIWSKSAVRFDISAVCGDSGATIVVERNINSAWTAYATIEADEDGNYSYTIDEQANEDMILRFVLTNGAGIPDYSAEYRLRVDTIAPEVTYVAYKHGASRTEANRINISGQEWTEDAVDIEFTITDISGSGVNGNSVKYRKGSAGEYTQLSAVGGKYYIENVQDTAEYEFVVQDNAGNSNIDQVYSWNIDAVAPTISDPIITTLDEGGNVVNYTGGWSAYDVTIAFNVTFAVKDVYRTGNIEYSLDDGVSWQQLDCTKVSDEVNSSEGIFSYVFTYVYKDNNISNIKYRAISLAKKTSEVKTVASIQVDSGEPDISASYTVRGEAWDFVEKPWATGNVVVNLSATLGISGGYIEVLKDGAVIDTLPGTTGTADYSYEIPMSAEVADYSFRAVKAGTLVSKTTDSQLVQFDAVTPNISIDSDYNMGTWINQNVVLSFTVTMGASYQQSSFFMTQGSKAEQLIWKTIGGAVDADTKHAQVSNWSVRAGETEGIYVITFDYTITSSPDVNPVIQTSVWFRILSGSGVVAVDNSYADTNSIRIDTFVPEIAVKSIVKLGSDAVYSYADGAWKWSDGKEWSSKQVRMTFSLTYFESGATLKYTENGGGFISTSVVYGALTMSSIKIGDVDYNVYTVDCILTISTDRVASYEVVAESGAGTSSAGYKATSIEEDTDNFTISLKIDMTNPSIGTTNYYRKPEGSSSYSISYNPERVKYVTDDNVKVVFAASDILTNGIASGIDIDSVVVTENGTSQIVTIENGEYVFYIDDCNEYIIEVTDKAGRVSTKSIKIGVDNVVPTLAVNVIDGNDGQGYSFDKALEDIAWSVEPLSFSFAQGTVFGSSGGVIMYLDSNTGKWMTVGVKETILPLNNKMTYGNEILFKARSNAGKESDIIRLALKLDLREYALTVTQQVADYVGQYADVSYPSTQTFSRGEVVEMSVTETRSIYYYNYRVVNGGEPIDDALVDGKFSVTVEDQDLDVKIFFKEIVQPTYSDLTQYLKVQELETPVSVTNSNRDVLDLIITYSIEVGGIVNSTQNIEVLGTNDDFPIGDYIIDVALADDTHYTLQIASQPAFEVRYFAQSGTADNPYLIDREEDLQYVNTTIYDSATAHFAMTKDIVLTSVETIGNFRGVLDGRNYQLSLADPLLELGFTTTPIFNEIIGTVENLGIEIGSTEVRVSGDYNTEPLYYGFLAAKLSGTVRNSYIVSTMQFVETGALGGRLFIGGLIGQVQPGGQLDRIYADAWLDIRDLDSVTSVGIGGVTGGLVSNTAVIRNSFSTSSIYAGNINIATGMLAPGTVYGSNNRVVDDNIYIGGAWTGVTGNTTYYQLITPQELGNTQITASNITGRKDPTFVLDLASDRYISAFDQEPTFENGNLCFEISTAEEFAKINDFLWADYIQVADIELVDVVIAEGSVYRGTYDGGGYSLMLNATTDKGYGLFDKVSGTIRNLNITTADEGFRANVTDGSDPTVALLVKELVGGTLDQIVIGGDFSFVSDINTGFVVGGLVGRATDATITDIVSTIYVAADAPIIEVGAIIGRATNTYIDNVYVVSTVNANYSLSASIGSIAGVVEGDSKAKYYYDDIGLYSTKAAGDVTIVNGEIESVIIAGNVIDSNKYFMTTSGLINYNGNDYLVREGKLYLAVGVVEVIAGTVNSIIIDGKNYVASRLDVDADNSIIEVTGAAYAFNSNTYANGESRERLVGQENGTGLANYTYTTLDSLMDANSTAIISEGNYVRDNLYEMYHKEFKAGTGTATDPFILAEKSDFKKISRYMYAHYKIKLDSGVGNLTWEEGEWQTIGVGMNFTGSITADSYIDNLGYPKSVALYGITDTFIDRNYGTISDFIINVDINKEVYEDYTFGVVANHNYGTISNMDISGTVVVFVRGAYQLVAGGIVGEYAAQDATSSIISCSVNISAIFRGQTVVAGIVAGRATTGKIESIGLESSFTVYAAEGKGILGAYLGEQDGDVAIVRKANNGDIKNTNLILFGTTITDLEANLVGRII